MVKMTKGNFKAALESWREDYGDIVGLKLGSELTVILSDYDVINRYEVNYGNYNNTRIRYYY